MDANSGMSGTYFSECQLYSAQFYKQMKQNGSKILAVGATGGRNEVKFFESGLTEEDQTEAGMCSANFKPTYAIMDLKGGVQSIDFSYKSNRIVLGNSNGTVASFKLKI